jgi:hypothetical protein
VARKPKKDKDKPQVVGLVGIGFDNNDDMKRITRSDEFLIVGGSEETHEKMQDVAIRFSESLGDNGKRLEEASIEEVVEYLQKAMER